MEDTLNSLVATAVEWIYQHGFSVLLFLFLTLITILLIVLSMQADQIARLLDDGNSQLHYIENELKKLG